MPRDFLDQQIEAAFQRHKQGDLRFANTVYLQALAQRPDHPAALHYLGLIAQQTGRSSEAVKLLERSLAVKPDDPRVLNHLGQVFIALKDTAGAAKSFERALEIDPKNAEALNNLANVVRSRDLLQAIDLYRRALALNPRAAFAAFNLAQALNEDGAFDEAIVHFQRAISLEGNHLDARHALGVLLEQRGAFDDAIDQYLAVQKIQPTHISSLANLLDIRDYQPDFAMVAKAEALLKELAATEEDRIKLHHGLGKHYDRQGEFDRAFSHFAASKSLLRSQRPAFDAAKVDTSFEALKRAFGPGAFGPERAFGSRSDRPVFIVGLPRSGTTLTEQILASHPLAFGAGELRKIPETVKFLRPDYPEGVADLTPDDLSALANDYLSLLDGLAPSQATRVSDKLPTNSLHLGLIATLFPEARVVYCRRDPLDVALSCFVELFDLEQDFTTALGDFSQYFQLHEALMAHWRAVLPMEIHELRYEDMVANPEKTTRALIDYCGLPWDPACLDFTATERAVKTPSRWQVRQPIYDRSVGRWRNYSSHMAALATQLEEAGYDYTAPDAPKHPTSRAPNLDRAASRGRRSLPAVLNQPIFVVAAPRSGSTLLFETLAESSHFVSLGGEAHWVVENVRALRPGATGVESNRLTAQQLSDPIADYIVGQITEKLVDRTRSPVPEDDNRVFLEKTPKNALRIPFFNAIFPSARFIFLWRDPRENLGSIMDAWRSGRFTTYPRLDGFSQPWSLLLPPNYASVEGKPPEDIAAFQWEQTNRIVLDDLQELDSQRWISVRYADLIANPAAETRKICRFADLDVDPALAARVSKALPHSRYTQTAPRPEKWRAHETKILQVLPGLQVTWDRLLALPK